MGVQLMADFRVEFTATDSAMTQTGVWPSVVVAATAQEAADRIADVLWRKGNTRVKVKAIPAGKIGVAERRGRYADEGSLAANQRGGDSR